MPARPESVSDEDIVRGLYRFRRRRAWHGARRRARARSGHAPRRRLDHAAGAARAAAARRARCRGRGVERSLLPAAAQRGARGRPLEPAPPDEEQRTPLVTELLREPAEQGPIIAVSDFITAWPDMISRWVPGGWWRSLGPTASAAATRARRCAASSRSTPSTSLPPRSPSWRAAAGSTRARRASTSPILGWTQRRHSRFVPDRRLCGSARAACATGHLHDALDRNAASSSRPTVPAPPTSTASPCGRTTAG